MQMIANLLQYKKHIAAVAGIATLLVTLYQLHDSVYDSGYSAAVVELTAKHNQALEDARKQYEKEINDSISRMQIDHKEELQRVRNEREIITKVEKVTEYVDKEIIVEAQCDELAANVVSVLKQATDITSASSATKD